MTAREHYLCHWLLVKRYDIDTVERKKMIKAWFIMAGIGNNLQRPTRCMNVYAKYRNEMSEVMSESQSGKLNSQFGKHWFTDLRTGESKSFLEKPNDFWIEGRNWFYKSKTEIYSIKTRKKIYDAKGKLKSDRKQKFNVERQKMILKLWNEFLDSEFDSVIKFNLIKCPTLNLHKWFRKFIPDYNKYKKNLTTFNKCPFV